MAVHRYTHQSIEDMHSINTAQEGCHGLSAVCALLMSGQVWDTSEARQGSKASSRKSEQFRKRAVPEASSSESEQFRKRSLQKAITSESDHFRKQAPQKASTSESKHFTMQALHTASTSHSKHFTKQARHKASTEHHITESNFEASKVVVIQKMAM